MEHRASRLEGVGRGQGEGGAGGRGGTVQRGMRMRNKQDDFRKPGQPAWHPLC